LSEKRNPDVTAIAPLPLSLAAQGAYRTSALKVVVRGLHMAVEIGVHAHEHGRLQPLIIDVELDLLPDLGLTGFAHIHDTVNYEAVLTKARAVAAAGHILLVEAFAQRLAQACLDDNRVLRVRVRVDKPEALAPDAKAASVEIVVERA
jgi:dihydroneopterin aldolase